MDVTYLHVWAIRLLSWRSFHRLRGDDYTRHASHVLSGFGAAAGATSRLYLTCAQTDEGAVLDTAALASRLSEWVAGRACVVLAAVSEVAAPEEGHSRRASELGLAGGVAGVFCAEVVLVRDLDEAARRAVLSEEAQRASKEGREEDRTRLLAQVRTAPCVRGRCWQLRGRDSKGGVSL